MQESTMELDSPPEQVWVREGLVVGESAVAGRDLFSSRHIPAGAIVLTLAGRLVNSKELNALLIRIRSDPDAPYVDSITVFEDAHLVLRPGTPVHFANHSCEPNLWYSHPYALGASRDIAVGEELTVDYGTISGDERFVMHCTCHGPPCRGVITSDDWRQPILQAKYAAHWTPALQRRIEGV